MDEILLQAAAEGDLRVVRDILAGSMSESEDLSLMQVFFLQLFMERPPWSLCLTCGTVVESGWLVRTCDGCWLWPCGSHRCTAWVRCAGGPADCGKRYMIVISSLVYKVHAESYIRRDEDPINAMNISASIRTKASESHNSTQHYVRVASQLWWQHRKRVIPKWWHYFWSTMLTWTCIAT